jgi:hypothetical protein
MPWSTLVTLGLIAGAQMLTGLAMISTGFGASVGMGLITEGIADIGIMAKTAYTKEFSWQDYGTQKLISLTISALTCGYG